MKTVYLFFAAHRYWQNEDELQAAYAELYFTDTLWPDFSPNELDAAIAEFNRRHRRFGAI